MPTFNPAPFDPTKPETAPSVPTTADQRGQHQNGNTAFTAAHADVTALEGHVATGPIHVDHTAVDITAGAGLTGGGTIDLSRSLAVGAGEGITVNADDVAATWGGSGGDFGTATTIARSDHLHGQYLTSVNQDPAPVLGGDLQTKGNDVLLTTGADEIRGILAPFFTGPGAALAYTADGTVTLSDGALTVEPGVVNIYGASVTVPTLKHSTEGGEQVYVGGDGTLYSLPAPARLWQISDTDTGSYALGSGAGTGAWVEMTGLAVTTGPGQDIAQGDQLQVQAQIYCENGGDQGGNVDVYLLRTGDTPPDAGATPDDSIPISRNFAGHLFFGLNEIASQAFPQPQTLTIWARRSGGGGGSFAPILNGATNDHAMTLSALTTTAGGNGDVVQGTGGATGQVAVWQDFGGKLIHGTGIASTDLARLSASNVFTDDQTIETSGADIARMTLSQTGTSVVTYRMSVATAAADQGIVDILTRTDGNFAVRRINDDLSAGATVMESTPGGNVDFPSGTLSEQGQRVYSPNNPPPGGGGGDMTAPGTIAVGELYTAANTSGTQTARANILATDVARLSQTNVFTVSPQTIASPTSGGGLDITASATPRVRLKSTGGLADKNDQRITQTQSGYLRFAAHNDAGTNVGEMLQIWNYGDTGAAGGVVVGSTTTGGDQGFGTINAAGVYVNGVELTGNVNAGAALPAGELVQGSGGTDVATSSITAADVARLDIGQTYTGNDTRDNGGAWRFRNEAQVERGLIRARNTPTDELVIIGSTSAGPIDSTVRIQGTGITFETASAGQAVNVETGQLQERGNRALTVAGGQTIADTGGFATAFETVADAAITPQPTGGQVKRLTHASPTINAMTEQGMVTFIVPETTNPSLVGYVVKGGKASSGVSTLQVINDGTDQIALWSDPA